MPNPIDNVLHRYNITLCSYVNCLVSKMCLQSKLKLGTY